MNTARAWEDVPQLAQVGVSHPDLFRYRDGEARGAYSLETCIGLHGPSATLGLMRDAWRGYPSIALGPRLLGSWVENTPHIVLGPRLLGLRVSIPIVLQREL
jgi:hypothetical protein